MIHNVLAEFYTDIFSDKRLDKRANIFLTDMIEKGSSIINQCYGFHAERQAAYRLLNNEKCSLASLSAALYRDCRNSVVASSHLLCIQDTTEFNYTAHIKGIGYDDEDLGPGGCDSNAVYFCHPTLVLDAASEQPLGFSCVDLWNRSWDKSNKLERKYRQLPIEEKESNRWLTSIEQSKSNLATETIKTFISDRESDIYQLFTLCDSRNLLLIRSTGLKRTDEGMNIKSQVQQWEVKHKFELEVRGTRKRKKRTALLKLSFGKIQMLRPQRIKGNSYPSQIEVNCAYVKESAETTPAGEDPIEWLLLTTHSVHDIASALQCVLWYRLRWYIEELFRILKLQGFNLEASQLESGLALKRLLLFTLRAALQTMILKIAYDKEEENQSLTLAFSKKEIALLNILLPSLEGKTQKQKNPFKQQTMAWSAWIIAKLGAWNGYKTQSPPGYITFKRGLDNFGKKMELFNIIEKNVCKE